MQISKSHCETQCFYSHCQNLKSSDLKKSFKKKIFRGDIVRRYIKLTGAIPNLRARRWIHEDCVIKVSQVQVIFRKQNPLSQFLPLLIKVSCQLPQLHPRLIGCSIIQYWCLLSEEADIFWLPLRKQNDEIWQYVYFIDRKLLRIAIRK